MEDPRGFLQQLFEVAVEAALPRQVLPPFLPQPPAGRTLVIGAGKAASAMAQVVDAQWEGELSGLVVTRYGQGRDCGRIQVREASHPVPDAAGESATREMLALCNNLGKEDLVLCLISGGGSALLPLPGEGISLAEKQALSRQLLQCGASISEINTVRKHISAVKGGRLAAACFPARVVSLLVSDVPGDDPELIASGPTIADPSSTADAIAILARYGISPPPGIEAFLQSEAAETPKPGDPVFEHCEAHIVAGPQVSLQAAAEEARKAGINALILADAVEGEAREVGKAFAAIARQVKYFDQPIAKPCVILSGGETTVSIKGTGKGGPNSEFNLAMAIALGGTSGITAIACDTDGIDGSEDNAGCIIDATTLQRAQQLGMDPASSLDDNDAWSFFNALGDLVVSGPTHTNVNDFRAMLIE